MKKSGENLWLKKLPAHAPPEGMWDRIETRMDKDLVNERFREQLAALPEHESPFGLWSRIERKLTHRRYLRLGLIASGIAATLLLALVLRGLISPEPTKNQSFKTLARSAKENVSPGDKSLKQNRTEDFAIAEQKKQKTVNPLTKGMPQADPAAEIKSKTLAFDSRKKQKIVALLEKQKNVARTITSGVNSGLTDSNASNAAFQYKSKTSVFSVPADFPAGKEILFALQPLKIKSASLNPGAYVTHSPANSGTNTDEAIAKIDTLTSWLLARNSKENFPPPPSPALSNQPKGISIGFNYLPEPMSKSDYASSAYQTFALMAQYHLPAVDLRTGFGISYQSAPMEYSTDYASFSTAFGNGKDSFINNGDTLKAALLDAGAVDISGNERSSFLYYTIGAGKRIYSNKRISTSVRVGGGFSLLLGNQHKISGPVYDMLRTKSNTFFGNTESSVPDVNRTHFDLVTSFDFNYRLLRRWSLSIEPMLKYYFNPVYKGNKARTFSPGLSTGILFKL